MQVSSPEYDHSLINVGEGEEQAIINGVPNSTRTVVAYAPVYLNVLFYTEWGITNIIVTAGSELDRSKW